MKLSAFDAAESNHESVWDRPDLANAQLSPRLGGGVCDPTSGAAATVAKRAANG